MSFSVRARPAGHPSTTAPMHLPWLSPNVTTTKRSPQMFPVITSLPPHSRPEPLKVFQERGIRNVQRLHPEDGGSLGNQEGGDRKRHEHSVVVVCVQGRAPQRGSGWYE